MDIKYLLDANCFYAIKKNESKKKRLYEARDNIVISPISIMEIANLKVGEFDKRKDAMRALNYTNASILQETTDDIVAKAFGIREPQKKLRKQIDWRRTYVNPIVNSNSYESAKSKVNIEFLNEWKKTHSDWFVNEIVEGNKEERTIRISELKTELGTDNERILKHIAVEKGKESSEDISGYVATVCGLSVRAGLHSEEDYQNAISNGHFVDSKFIENAINNYNFKLDSYIKFYQIFQSEMAELGKKPEKNAIWDLNYMLYLDMYDLPLTFVTTEEFLLKIGEKSIPDRVVDFSSFLTSLT